MYRKKYIFTFLSILIILSCITGSVSAKKTSKKHKKSYKYNKKYHSFHPKDYKVLKPKFIRSNGKLIVLNFYSKSFSQGEVIYLEIRKSKKLKKEFNVKEIVFHKKSFNFTKHDFGYRSLIPINGNLKPGISKFIMDYEIDGKKLTAKVDLKIKRSKFIFSRRPLDLGKHSNVEYQETPENLAFIKKCSAKKRKAFSRNSSNKITDSFAHPRDYHYITSPFWAKRTIMQYKIRKKKKIRLKNRIKVHRGLDLRGETGENVFSIAHGKVALAEDMFYEGNFVVIDHGNKVFSYYMHLDKLNVKEGDVVEAGQKIASVGSTGVSTAAHLHVSFMIQGVQVHPLSLLGLPIKK